MDAPSDTPAVLITGGSSGIGLATAGRLLERGGRVCLLARDQTRLQAAREILLPQEKREDRLWTVAADVAVRDELNRAIDSVLQTFGSATHVVCSAGTFQISSFDETTSQEFQAALDVNLTGVFNTCAALLSTFYERGKGHLLAVGSVAAKQTFPGNAAYSASKFGLRGLMGVLAAEANPRGVTVSMVHPPAVATPLWDQLSAEVLNRFDRKSFLPASEVAASIVDALLDPPGPFNDIDLF
jgi:NAD(P)-dependent dehydrogenase (short-subunit alcohol dehydrogenase family)